MLKTLCQNVVSQLETQLSKKSDAKKMIPFEWAKVLLRCFDGDQPVCWLGFNAPVEIPIALGYLPFYPELISGMLAGYDMSADLVEFVERKFSNYFCCSFHRCSMASAIKGIYPKPDAILSSSNICDGQVKQLNIFGDIYGIEPVTFEVPYNYNEKSKKYSIQQLEGIISIFENLSGQKLTDEKLRDSIRISNQSYDALFRLNELRKHSPSPFHGARAMNAIYVLMTQLWGLPQAIDLLDRLSSEIEEDEKNGRVTEEKYRLLVMIPPPTFKNDIYNWLEKEMHANMVMAELTEATWEKIDEKDPLPGLAGKSMSLPFIGPVENRVKWALKAVKDYNIDAVLHFSHWGCRQSSGGVGILSHKFEQAGIPFLNLDMDLIDPRSFSPGQVYTRIQSFIEMLSHKKEEGI